jgi:hypothetical protein
VTRREQLECFDLSPDGSLQIPLFAKVVKDALDTALQKRRQLESFPVNDVRDADEKTRLLSEAEQALDLTRLAGDLLVGGDLASPGSGRSADSTEAIAERFAAALREDLSAAERAKRVGALRERARELLDSGKPPAASPRQPLHWALEFPEILADDDRYTMGRGFDAFVGNPPFQGGKKITGALGTDYRDHVVERIGRGVRGHADLCAYMFLRASSLLRPGGSFGLLATNTIAQGDTREVGLDQLLADGT